MEVRVYDRNLASPTLWTIEAERVSQLRFSTKIPGGFNVCSFRLRCGLGEAWDWLTKRLNYRVMVSDLASTLFEGRVEDIRLSPAGGVEIVALGYYSNLGDIPYTTAYNAVASEVIKAVLTANCAQVNADQTHIAATDVMLNSAVAEEYLDKYPIDLFQMLLTFSDTTSKVWDFAIWEDRVPWLTARNVTAVDWWVSLADLRNFEFGISLSHLWNAAYAIWRNAGVLQRTADADDTGSQTRYGLERKKRIGDLGDVPAANAQAARDGFLPEYSSLYPGMAQAPTIVGPVYDLNGVPHGAWEVRAGQVLRVRDLVPDTHALDAVSRDGLSTFWLAATEWDNDARQLRIEFERREPTIEQLMAKVLKLVEPFDWLGADQAALSTASAAELRVLNP